MRSQRPKKPKEITDIVHDIAWAKSKLGAQSTKQLLDRLDCIRTYFGEYMWACLEEGQPLLMRDALYMFQRLNQIFIDIEVHGVSEAGSISNHVYSYPIIIETAGDIGDTTDAYKRIES